MWFLGHVGVALAHWPAQCLVFARECRALFGLNRLCSHVGLSEKYIFFYPLNVTAISLMVDSSKTTLISRSLVST